MTMEQAQLELMLALCSTTALLLFFLLRAAAKVREVFAVQIQNNHLLRRMQFLRRMRPIPASLNGGTGRIVRTIIRRSDGILIVAAAAGLACCAGLYACDSWRRASRAETQAHTVETFSLSSVAGSVPGREIARKAQAAAIMEAQRMGLDISIASVGAGGKSSGDSAADERAFARLAQRFPETLKAAEEGDAFRERLSKTWISGSKALADGRAPNGISQIISEAGGRVGACVVEMHASGESLRAMLVMAYDESAIDAIERKARSLGISAADVAFLVSAHESAHCVIGMARRAGIFDTSWADPGWNVPPSWRTSQFEDDHDSPALAKAEEGAADVLAVFWAADVLGARKARKLGRLAIYGRARGAQSSARDGLHDSSRVLSRILASVGSDRSFAVANPARLAWQSAARETRVEVLESTASGIAEVRARQ
jgi:hypothetical protein